jgi:hypothetical protein
LYGEFKQVALVAKHPVPKVGPATVETVNAAPGKLYCDGVRYVYPAVFADEELQIVVVVALVVAAMFPIKAG